MELIDVARSRRMVRTYDAERGVPHDTLTRILDLATRAPSAGFAQGRDFVVLADPKDRERFWAATTDPGRTPDRWLTGMRTAPVLVLCLSDPVRYLDRYAEPDKGGRPRDESLWPVPYWDVDTGMAAMIMLLAAVDAGLGGCFFGVPPERHPGVRTAFGIPGDRRIVGVVSLGHPAPDRRSPSLRRGRRPLGEVAHDGRFGVPWNSERSGTVTNGTVTNGAGPRAPGGAAPGREPRSADRSPC